MIESNVLILTGYPSACQRSKIGISQSAYSVAESPRARRRGIPGRVRQQQVRPRRAKLKQGLIHPDGVVSNVDGAEKPRIEMHKTVTRQQPDSADDRVVAAATVTVISVPVVRHPVAVKGNANADAILVEKLTELLVKQHAIGVHLNVEAAQAAKRTLKLDEDRAQPGHSGQQRLAAMQHYLDAAKLVRLDVLGDAHRRAGDNVGRMAMDGPANSGRRSRRRSSDRMPDRTYCAP